ncbi:hypothetical protein MYU51_017519 [Penicillium brevicompactum]|uniref:uncharacterized protein n=1 Tax=Penicillium brevicompactum TaxID=5074 RepID=UPI002541C8EE|nr:uncharacterized protein N7506_012079 [Penicillium brevicompactum]KAJ5319375.1 hypothetical protein N7506_012079 [Penicillium brevicompactum]
MNPTNNNTVSSWTERAEALKRVRTCFLHNSNRMPVNTSESSIRKNVWYTVRIYKEDERFSDEELVNISIQRLREGYFVVEQKPELQHRGWHISYPIVDLVNADKLDLAIDLARSRRDDIVKGEISLDRIMIFTKKIPEPTVKLPEFMPRNKMQ